MTIRTNGHIIGGMSDGMTEWGKVEGTLSNQTDLQAELNAKLDESKIQVVTALPENPTPGVFYFVVES